MKPKVLVVLGTRPEAIKLAPLILRLRGAYDTIETLVVATGQHRELLDQALAEFSIEPEINLELMQERQDHAQLLSRAIERLSEVYRAENPSLVVAQGDTTSVLAAALAAFYQKIPFAHVEAGLRTGDRSAPFPEEQNRILVSHCASLHFAPTEVARSNLLREGIDPHVIHVTGNTVVDAVWEMAEKNPPLPEGVEPGSFLLVTIHRRESFGPTLESVCEALIDLVRRNDDMRIVLPVHPNPEVRQTLTTRLAQNPSIALIEPQPYSRFVALLMHSRLILSDSGGVQEEGLALGKKVLVVREKTERSEGLADGLLQIVGVDRAAIMEAVSQAWGR